MKHANSKLLSISSGALGIHWPPVSTGLPATLASLLYQLEESQWCDEKTLVENQLRQLRALAAHSVGHSPHFRARMKTAGLSPEDFTSLEALRKLPPLTRRDIQSGGADFACDSMPQSHLPVSETQTSGSTGEPVKVRKTEIDKLFWMANTMREHFWHKRDFNGNLFITRANAEPATLNGWGFPITLFFPSGQTRIISSLTDIREQVRDILQFKPSGLLIYPSTLAGLLAECEKQKLKIEGLQFIWCFGETLSPELRKKAEAFFGAPVQENYSSVEVGIIALQCPESGLFHIMSESVIVEILNEAGEPCREGEAGRVAITSLHNFAMPIIRYLIGDIAVAGGKCSCGRGLPTIQKIAGRQRNLVVKPDGSRGWPEIGFKQFLDVAPVSQFQFIQHDLQHIEARFATTRPVKPSEEAALKKAILDALGHPFTLSFTYFDDRIPLGPNGKFEEFICKVA